MISSIFETGDILLYQGKKYWYERFIEYFTNSNFSHVSIIVKNPKTIGIDLPNGLYILESGMEPYKDVEDGNYKTGVQLVNFEKHIENCKREGQKIWYRKLYTKRDEKFYNTLKEIHKQVHGKTYDFDAIDWLEAYVRNVYKSPINKQRTDKFWCSALVCYVYVKLGLIDSEEDWTHTRPSDFSSNYNTLKFIQKNLTQDNVLI